MCLAEQAGLVGNRVGNWMTMFARVTVFSAMVVSSFDVGASKSIDLSFL
jgi:hypothetical protein